MTRRTKHRAIVPICSACGSRAWVEPQWLPPILTDRKEWVVVCRACLDAWNTDGKEWGENNVS